MPDGEIPPDARRQERADLVKLTAFATSLLRQLHLDDLLWAIAEDIGRILGFPDCVIYLLEGDTLVQRAACGVKHSGGRAIVNPIKVLLGQGITGTAAATGEVQWIADVSQDERYIFDVYAGRSELAVPILYEDRVLGVIDSESDVKGFYSRADVELMTTLARRLRAGDTSGPRPRVIAMTASAMLEDREACFDAGMDDYVSKPVRIDELEAAMERSKPSLSGR